jgi:hypothetical protein
MKESGCADLRMTRNYIAYFSTLAHGLPQVCRHSVSPDTSAYLFMRTTVQSEDYLSTSPAPLVFPPVMCIAKRFVYRK